MIYCSAKVRKKLHIGYGKYSLGTNLDEGVHAKKLNLLTFFEFDCGSFPGCILVLLLSGADIGELGGLQGIREKDGRIIVEEPDSCMVPFSLKRVVQAELAVLETSPFKIANQIVDYTSSKLQLHLKI